MTCAESCSALNNCNSFGTCSNASEGICFCDLNYQGEFIEKTLIEQEFSFVFIIIIVKLFPLVLQILMNCFVLVCLSLICFGKFTKRETCLRNPRKVFCFKKGACGSPEDLTKTNTCQRLLGMPFWHKEGACGAREDLTKVHKNQGTSSGAKSAPAAAWKISARFAKSKERHFCKKCCLRQPGRLH